MTNGTAILRSTESWAIPVIARENIPPRFAVSFATQFSPGEAPYLLHNPRQPINGQQDNEKLICLTKERLVVLSADRSPFSTAIKDIVSCRLEELLLAYSITVTTATDSIVIDFNAACSDLFEPITTSLRVKSQAPKDGRAEWRQISEVAAIDLKFANYMRQILRDSGQLQEYVLQQEIDLDKQPVVAASLILLTETELAWVMNEEKEWTHEPVYGAILSIAPRRQVIGLTLIPAPEYNLIHLAVSLLGNQTWKIPFAAERREDLERFIAKAS